MYVFTCLLRTGRTFLDLSVVYEGVCIRPWFGTEVREEQYLAKCPISPQRRQVYRTVLFRSGTKQVLWSLT